MAPMDTGFGNTEWGGFTRKGIEYFVRRAEGGFGLLFSGGTNSDCVVDGCDGILNHPGEFIAQGKELNARIAQYGCKMFIQLSMNVGRNGGLKTPSPLPTLGDPNVITKELTIDEIHTKVAEMGKAARLCKDAGFAGVDIHAMHWGHLLDSFALAFMNHRDDEYGGSLENRIRVAKEIVEAIKRDGIYLARRISGGGAVYHDMGNLNFTFIAKDGLFDVERQTDVILLACRLLGINAVKTGRNDLTVTGRKFSGHAYFSSHGFNYHHGTIMMDVKGDDLSKYLNVSAAKLKSKGVESVRSRVTNLREHVGEDLKNADTRELILAMQDAMVRAASREYGCEAEAEELPQIPQELLDKYASEEWRLGTKIPFTKNIEHRFEWGGVEIQLAMKGEYIRDCRIYSDALETEVFDIVEDLIKGCRYDAEDIRGLSVRLPEGTSATAHEILGLIAKSI